MEDLLSAIDTRADYEIMSVKIWRKRDKRLEENVRVKLTSSQNLKRGGGIASSGEKTSLSSVGSRIQRRVAMK